MKYTANITTFVFFLSLLAIAVFAAETTITVDGLDTSDYNVIFNPFTRSIPLVELQFKESVLQWSSDLQDWADADALASGAGFAIIPKQSSLSLKGTDAVSELHVKPGFFVIGSLKPSEKELALSELVISETGESLVPGEKKGFYKALYKYSPALGYQDVESGDKLVAGLGYMIEAEKSFTLKIKGTALPPASDVCSEATVDKLYKCSVTEQQYMEPWTNEYQTLSAEHDIKVCKKIGDIFEFAPVPKDAAKNIAEDGKCAVGYACRSEGTKAWCQQSSPPPFKAADGTVVGPRPAKIVPA